MILLGIDTAATTSVAVAELDAEGAVKVLAERTTDSTTDHAEQLSVNVQHVLAEAGKKHADLAGVVVGVGPGPFTGLRVGMVAAAAYGFAWDIPVHGVMSLDALAVTAATILPAGQEFLVAADARRKEIYYAHYRADDQQPVLVHGPAVERAENLDLNLRQLPVFGPGADLYREAFTDIRVENSELGPAARLIESSAQKLLTGEELLPLVPLYLRESDAKIPTQNWARNVR